MRREEEKERGERKKDKRKSGKRRRGLGWGAGTRGRKLGRGRREDHRRGGETMGGRGGFDKGGGCGEVGRSRG